MTDPLTRNVDESALANSIGMLLSTLRGTNNTIGQGNVVAAGEPLSDSPTQAGPIKGGFSSLTDLQSGKMGPPVQDPNAHGAPFAPLRGTPTQSGGISNGEANPVPNGPETISQGYGGDGGHPGIDIGVPVGTSLVAAVSGTVAFAGNDGGGYGNLVEIHGTNGLIVRYGHLSFVGVKPGDKVQAGQPIGKSGGIRGAEGSGNSTGPHLHFEVRQDGHSIDPSHFLAIHGNGVVQGDPGSVAPTAPDTTPVPSRTISDPDAVDTALARLTGKLSGKGDPGSENSVDQTPMAATPGTPAVGQNGSTADNDPKAIGAFLAATRQHESGGNYKIFNTSGQSNASGAYQFIGSTWRGMGGSTANAADASPQEQDAIATKMATQLFNQFHSWRLVAIAWYGGPAVAAQVAAGQDPGSPQGQGPYIAYGNTIQQMMSGAK